MQSPHDGIELRQMTRKQQMARPSEEVDVADEARERNAQDRTGRDTGEASDHNRQRIEEVNQKVSSGYGESSGSKPIDKVNEGARQVLGDAEVDYSAAEIYMEPDDAVLDAEGKAHGDRIARNPDGTHVVESVAPSPADGPKGGWADKPVGRKGDSVGDPQNAPGAINPESGR